MAVADGAVQVALDIQGFLIISPLTIKELAIKEILEGKGHAAYRQQRIDALSELGFSQEEIKPRLERFLHEEPRLEAYRQQIERTISAFLLMMSAEGLARHLNDDRWVMIEKEEDALKNYLTRRIQSLK